MIEYYRCPDYIKSIEDYFEYDSKREYLKTFKKNGNDIYSYETIKMILHLFPLEEAKKIINGGEINISLANKEYKMFAEILNIIKKEDIKLLVDLFECATDFVFINPSKNENFYL